MGLQKVVGCKVLALVLGLGISVIGTGFYCTAEAADWPNWRGPNYDGISSETGWSSAWPEGGPKLPWKASIGAGYCSISVSKGRAYTMGNIGNRDILYCFDAKTGNEIWKQSYACRLFDKNHRGGPAATPTVDGDAVYTFSKGGDVIRFNAATGDVVWHKNLAKELRVKTPTWYFAGSPFVTGDIVIYNAGSAGIALNKADGSLAWKSGTSAPGYATAVPYTSNGQKCVALFVAREIVGLAANTGKIIWREEWKTDHAANIADPIVTGDTVFISSGYNEGCAMLKIDGSGVARLWRNKNMRNHFNSSVLWKGHIYGFDDKALTCLDSRTGDIKWSSRNFGKGSLMLADGRLIILSDKGKLAIAAASPDGFTELASAQVLTGQCWTVPVLANGRIYARSSAGQLVCVDVAAN
jgi:outer membrane protein assembly factor BamB